MVKGCTKWAYCGPPYVEAMGWNGGAGLGREEGGSWTLRWRGRDSPALKMRELNYRRWSE